MATTTEKLEDSNLNEEDQDAIIGAFVRHQENERLRQHWEKLLKEKHQVSRSASATGRSATIRKIMLPVLAVAATLLLLFIFLPGMLAENGGQLLAENLAEIRVEGVRSEAVTTTDSLRRRLQISFSAEDFAAATATGERLLALPESTPEDQLNLGVAYLRAENYVAAGRSFSRLIEQPGDFITEARYYLGLSLLSAGNTEAGLAELKKIKEANGRRIYQKAQALINARW